MLIYYSRQENEKHNFSFKKITGENYLRPLDWTGSQTYTAAHMKKTPQKVHNLILSRIIFRLSFAHTHILNKIPFMKPSKYSYNNLINFNLYFYNYGLIKTKTEVN